MQKHTPDDIARFITGRLLNNHDTAGLPWQGHPAAVPEPAEADACLLYGY